MIRITDDKNEQINIGRELVKSKAEHYTKAVDRYIIDSIENSRPYRGGGVNEEEYYYLSVYHYWVYGVNAKEFIFYEFDKKNHEQKKLYLTYRSRNDYYFHMNNSSSAYILNDKYETYKRYKQFYKRDVIQINDERDFSVFKEFVDNHSTFVFKPSCMGLGAGIDKVSFNKSVDLKKEFLKLLRRGKVIKKMNPWRGFENIDSCVLEEIISEDADISKLHPYSINCIRIPSIYVKGETFIFHPYIKIGRNSKFLVDERTGSILAGINKDTGEIETVGFDENGYQYSTHPDTGIEIRGFRIPMWKDVIDMTKILAKNIAKDGINYVGWDFALTNNNGWCIVEGNYDGEFLGQLVCQAGHARELSNLLNWSPQKSYWWK